MATPTAIIPVTDYTFPNLDAERAILAAAGAQIAPHQCRDEAQVIDAIRGARVVLAQFAPITRAALASLAPGATVVRYGVGVDNIDLVAAADLGVQVAYVPDYCMDEVADHTVALLLALLRRLAPLEAELRAGGWAGIRAAGSLPPLNQIMVGFVGLGRIGRAVLARLRPFGCRFAVHDPALTADAAEALGVGLATLDELLAGADAISLHLPLTPATRHLINAERLARMRPGAVIVNTARGGLIDATALAEALRAGRLAGAALDVFEQEPLPVESPLRGAPRLTMTPHMSWYSDTAIGRLQRLAAEEAARAIRGEPLRCPISYRPS
jgi:D-3-phosphoglycerate dehydrogenase / 2-oxoglutarate reductase